ncbi:hypothetical protein C0991_004476 [Blastosporella zonata]|nr:hypothetical protein C0991_004476 [Blastosporella zonata]
MNPQNTRPSRRRTVSLSSAVSVQSRITLEFPKAQLATVTAHARSHTVYGSFTPTPSARPSLDHLKRSSARSKPMFSVSRLPRLHISTHYPWAEEESDSPLSSGSTSPSIPSFSRTASPPPVSTSTTLESPMILSQGHARKGSSELDPILAKLERKSKLLTKKVYCVTCRKDGWRKAARLFI